MNKNSFIARLGICLLFFSFISWVSFLAFTSIDRKQDKRNEDSEEKNRKQVYIHLKEIVENLRTEIPENLNLNYNLISHLGGEKIEELDIEFSVPHRSTIEEARILQAFLVDKIVKAVNAHEAIQPFFLLQPFTADQLFIRISYGKKYGHIADGTLISSSKNHGITAKRKNNSEIMYTILDAFSNRLVKIHREFYEEAIKKVHTDPVPYQPSEKEELIDEVDSSFAYEMLKLRLESRSIGGKMADKVEELGGYFIALGPVTQEQARQLIIKVTQKFLAAYNNEEKLRPYIKNYPLTSKDVKIRIEFRRREYYFLKDGSIDEVQLENNQLTFFTRRPPEPYSDIVPWSQVEFAKEPYSEEVSKE